MSANNLRCFVVSHDGLTLGGITIVFARDEARAEWARQFPVPQRETPWEIYGVREMPLRGATIIWDGDY